MKSRPVFSSLPLASLLFLALPQSPLRATGTDWLPPGYLEGDGKTLKAAPEFFWQTEIQRLAGKYRDKESASLKLKTPEGVKRQDFGNDETVKAISTQTSEADLADFEDAIKSGRLKPADADAARKAHAAARKALDDEKPLPGGETPGEFADYHAGAAAKSEEAVVIWKKLLARPKEERHYRSVWAAFMLGKTALRNEEWADAVKWFEQCRALAKEGFADSTGLAADSYGWQGRADLMAEHYPKAARLYLTQLALGDESAVVSLKRMIPEWTSPMSGGLPGEPAEAEEKDQPDAPEKKADDKKESEKPEDKKAEEAKAAADIAKAQAKENERWLEAAGDSVLQELVTAHVLATDTGIYPSEERRGRKWLDAIEKAGVKKVEDAAALAWIAYTAGDYKAAEAWLAKAEGNPPLARWLKAKMALRSGKFAEAAKLMEGVDKDIPAPVEQVSSSPSTSELAHGDTAALHFTKGEYVAALDEFRKGNCGEDITFMVESILTTEELLDYASKVPAPPKIKKKPAAKEGEEEAVEVDPRPVYDREFTDPQFIRSLIGRRLVREGRVKESRAFLSEEEQQTMDGYIEDAVKAEDKKLPALERAKAWWQAGKTMKEEGHTFRGTEADFHRPPSEEDPDYSVRTQRLTGKYSSQGGEDATSEKEDPKTGKRAVFLPATEEEKKRLAATAKHHAKAMRTRVVGANHVLAAAALLPNGSEEKARALNTAGHWLQDIDNPAADKIFSQLQKTCGNTEIGKRTKKKKWFLGETDPFNNEMPEE